VRCRKKLSSVQNRSASQIFTAKNLACRTSVGIARTSKIVQSERLEGFVPGGPKVSSSRASLLSRCAARGWAVGSVLRGPSPSPRPGRRLLSAPRVAGPFGRRGRGGQLGRSRSPGGEPRACFSQFPGRPSWCSWAGRTTRQVSTTTPRARSRSPVGVVGNTVLGPRYVNKTFRGNGLTDTINRVRR
jgi:hypothetical protein